MAIYVITLVASRRDPAGYNMYLRLKEAFKPSGREFEGNEVYMMDDVELVLTERDIIFCDHLDEFFDPEFYIFLSRHSSESGRPSLSAHFPGNFSDDESYGGRAKELSYTFPSLHQAYMRNLWELRDRVPGYQVVTEPMHHGPTSLSKPVLFVEIGSTPEEWNDAKAVEVVVEAVLETIRRRPKRRTAGIGLGGPHYSEKFTKFILKGEIPLGAIASKYALPHLDAELLSQMVEKSVEEIRFAVVDRKGLGREKARIIGLIEEFGLELLKV